jgi:peptidoglycan/xylan/chitin deacetylase (PgdA/CDA1 family)
VLSLYLLIWLTSCSSSRDQDKNSRQEFSLVVLNYHKIGNHDEIYSVSSKQLIQQVEYLLNQGYSVINLADFKSWRQGTTDLPDKVFMLTFDDGTLSDYETVYPFLKKYGLKGIFFLKTMAINTEGHLNSAQIKEMADSGICEFGSHSVNHRNVTSMGENSLAEELTGSRNTIQSITGQDVYAFAYPNGMWDYTAEKVLLENGYQFAFTVMPGLNGFATNPLELRRIIVKNETSLKTFVDWVEREPKLYKKYYSAMLEKARTDGLTAVAQLCEEELKK